MLPCRMPQIQNGTWAELRRISLSPRAFQLRASHCRSKNRRQEKICRINTGNVPPSSPARAYTYWSAPQMPDESGHRRLQHRSESDPFSQPFSSAQTGTDTVDHRRIYPQQDEHFPVQRSLVEEMRMVFRHLPQSAVIVTSQDPSDPKTPYRGATVSSFAPVSVQPEITVSLNFQLPSATFDAIERSGKFEIKLLKPTKEAAGLAHQFSLGHSRSPFQSIPAISESQGGHSSDVSTPSAIHPLLASTISVESPVVNSIACTYLPYKTVRICDHAVIFGHITTVPTTNAGYSGEDVSCLAYQARRYGVITLFNRRQAKREFAPRDASDIKHDLVDGRSSQDEQPFHTETQNVRSHTNDDIRKTFTKTGMIRTGNQGISRKPYTHKKPGQVWRPHASNYRYQVPADESGYQIERRTEDPKSVHHDKAQTIRKIEPKEDIRGENKRFAVTKRDRRRLQPLHGGDTRPQISTDDSSQNSEPGSEEPEGIPIIKFHSGPKPDPRPDDIWTEEQKELEQFANQRRPTSEPTTPIDPSSPPKPLPEKVRPHTSAAAMKTAKALFEGSSKKPKDEADESKGRETMNENTAFDLGVRDDMDMIFKRAVKGGGREVK